MTRAFSVDLPGVTAISVAIPTFGRPEWALAATKSVLRVHAGVDFEILVLDNGCDPALERAVSALSSGDLSVRYIQVPDVGLHNGRHAAAKAARGDVLAYLDDDVLVDEGWLTALAEAFADPSVHLVGGPCRPLFEGSPPSWLEAMWVHQPDGIIWCGPLSLIDAGPSTRDIDPRFVLGANFAVRKSTLIGAGGFHPDGVPWELRRFRGDGETAVSVAVERLGLRSVYHPLAAVRHRVPRERMTEQYLERRALLQGISDSFTDLRARTKRRRSPLADTLRRVRDAVKGVARGRAGARPTRIDRALVKAHASGYEYHQDRARFEAAVRDWVHRPDYWDAAIPEIEG
jgi:glycosyltransferase involved in cell wall biosynthesis